MYWEILSDEMYDLDKPPKLGMGQLYDDWAFLAEILEDESEAIPPMLIHIAPILMYIAYRGKFFD